MDAIEYIRKIPPPFRAVVEDIRSLIFSEVNEVKEKFKNHVPTYETNHVISFIEKNPKEHVLVGFPNLKDYKIPEPYKMDKGNGIDYVEVNQLDDIMKTIIQKCLRNSV